MSGAFADELCPQATDRLQRAVFYGNLKERVTAPTSSEEARQRLTQLDSLSGDRRTAAVMALGLGGNMDAFARFLAARAGDDLFIYASSYLNADGTVCVDPAIERAMIEHLGAPELDRGLLGLLYKNKFRSRELLAVLLAVPMDVERPRDYLPRARALTATNLPGIEAGVLERAMSLPGASTPVLRYVLPDIHRHFIEFFGTRAYAPALTYLRQRLDAAPRGEPQANLRNGNLHTRLAVYRALRAIEGNAATEMLLNELAALVRADWDDYFSPELHDLVAAAMDAATTRQQRGGIVAALRAILDRPSMPGHPGYVTPQPEPAGHPGYYDYLVRKGIYERLPMLADAGSGDVLADELARVTGSPVDTNREALVIQLVEAVRQWPPSKALDAARLARLSAAINNEISAVSLLTALYESRPGTDVVGAIVSRLDRLDAVHASDPRLAGPLRDGLFNLALRAQDHALARALRMRLDRRFEAGDLAREEYRRWSLAFNDVLGDESEAFLSMEEALQAEREQERDLERRRKQQQIERSMNAELAAHASAEGIRADIAALSKFGSAARNAAQWLVRVGPAALPSAHAALSDTQSNTVQRMQLMTVLGEIGDSSSTPHIIAATRGESSESRVYKHAFLALARIPQTAEATAFADGLLDGNAPASAKAAALTYFALQRDRRAERWIERYTRADTPAEVSIAALFLAARIDAKGAGDALRRRLQEESDRARRRDLLQALAEIADPEDLAAIASRAQVAISDRDMGRLVRYARFRQASPADKAARAAEVLEDPVPLLAREAARYLIAENRVDILARWFPDYLPPQSLWQLSPASRIIETEAWRMGRRLDRGENGVRLLHAP